MKPLYVYNATVEKVVDADTIDVIVDLGFKVTTTQRVRLEGINAPEKSTPEGMAAKNWLLSRIGIGSEVVIKSSKPGTGDKYGRWLAMVYLGTENLNNTLVELGHAFSWDGQGAKPV